MPNDVDFATKWQKGETPGYHLARVSAVRVVPVARRMVARS